MPGENRTKENFFNSRLMLYLIAGVLAAAIIGYHALLSPVAGPGQAREVTVTIPPRATAVQVGALLKQSGIIKSPLAFRFYARLQGLDESLKAGEYRISNGLSTPAVLRELVDGRLSLQTVTVPEGYTTAGVAELLAGEGLVDRERFLSAAGNDDFPYDFISGLPHGSRRLEGYLFPDTYQVARGSGERAVIDLMLSRFEKEIKDLNYEERAGQMGLTLHQAVTVASMVESEAKVDRERPLIAGVIYNRLKRSMPLQIDATVQYALAGHKEKLYYKDLEVDSPYNTYKIKGLPPGPIAMPGRASLIAAVNPVQTDYLYYVAKPDGTHAFAVTLEEHNANREKYQPG
ncbi:MAG: endolytic transglycosylase MltG [Firmicutes bacterium]|nr:endolytic transglycosylase MltG [Bacillota bacterium]